MEAGIQIFENPQFGNVRVAMSESNEPLFCLADVAKALDIKNVSDLKSRLNQKGIAITDTPTKGGIQPMIYINEGNVYKCIFQSRKSDAEKFQDWVCDEVLPSIRKTGGLHGGEGRGYTRVNYGQSVIDRSAYVRSQASHG